MKKGKSPIYLAGRILRELMDKRVTITHSGLQIARPRYSLKRGGKDERNAGSVWW